MAKQTINIGSSANDGTGDPVRTAFNKVNQNFTEVYEELAEVPVDISDLTDVNSRLFPDVSDLPDTENIIEKRYASTRRSYTVKNIDPSSLRKGNIIPQDISQSFVSNFKDTSIIIFHAEDDNDVDTASLFENAVVKKQSFELYVTDNQGNDNIFLTRDVEYVAEPSNYRGYQASYNTIYNTGKKSINQIVIYEEGVTPTANTAQNTGDNFTVSGLTGSTTIGVITIFGSTDEPIGRGQLWSFFKEFVDSVLYTASIQNAIETIKTKFYENIENLKSRLPSLYPDLHFYANNSITASSGVVSGGSGSGAAFSLLTGRYEGESWRNGGIINPGSGYEVGDTLTILGTNLGGTANNNASILITGVDGSGEILDYTISGIATNVWPINSIQNGGFGQYNPTGNIINTNISSNVPYAGGNRVPSSALGNTPFGVNSSYNVLYKDSIFAIIAKSADITSLNFSGTFGNSLEIKKTTGYLSGVKGYKTFVENISSNGQWVTNRQYNVSYSYAGYDIVRIPGFAIDNTDIENWNTAYSWGNHNDGGYVLNNRPYAVTSFATGVITHNVGAFKDFLYKSPIYDWTINLVDLNLNGFSTTEIRITVEQGAVPFLPVAVQIEGVPGTINWQGGVVPTGTANGVDVVTFSIVSDGPNYLIQAWIEKSSGGGGLDISNISGDLIPSTDSTYDLGSAANQWRSLYVSSSTIFVGGTPISVDESGNLLVDGTPVVETIESVSASNNFMITAGETNTWEFNTSGNIIFPNGQQINAEDANELLIGTTNAGLILNSQTQSSRLVAKKTFDREFNYGVDQAFSATVGPPHLITVTFGTDTGLYLLPLLERLESKLSSGSTDFRYDYSNIRMVINPYAEAISANISMVSQTSGTTWEITIDQDPTAVVDNVTDIQILYDYNNTVGLDVGEDMFGIATDNDDIDIRSGRDIDLIAADDITFRAGSTFDLTLLRNDDQDTDSGIEIITDSSTLTNIWKFQFDGTLRIPGNIEGTDGIIIKPDIGETYAYLNLPSDEDSSSQGVALGNDNGKIELRTTDQATSSSYTWRFDNDGSLTAPGTITSTAIQTDSITIGVGGNVNGQGATLGNFSSIDTGELINEGNVSIVVANTHTWSFGSNGDIEVPGKIILANGAQIFDTAGIENSITIGATDTNGTTTFNGSGFFNGNVYFHKAIQEKFTSLQDATGVVTHDCANSHIFYHTSPDANWTVNLTNFPLVLNYATTVTLIISQGGTGYYPSALQIGGAAQTINWQGNATPTPSSNRVDVVSFSIYRTGAGYTVLGQLVGF